MKVMLTGATGFVGLYVARELKRQDIEYLSLQRGMTNDDRAIQMDLLGTNELDALFQKFKPTHLVHMAWYTEHGKYWDSELNLQWILATKRLVDAFCSSGGQHVVITGSCAEYDWSHGYCVEDVTPLKPKSLYGICKDTTRRVIEQVVENHGVSMSWTRVFFPYGPGEASQRLIPSLFKAFKGEIIPFKVSANSYRDFLHVEDAARAVLACAQSKFVGAINICSGKPVQISKVVDSIAKLNNCNSEIILKLTQKNQEINRFLVGDNKKLENLGWRQEIMLDQGLFNYQSLKILNK
jgi:nucleoside-diphosphate-sugar epimerase